MCAAVTPGCCQGRGVRGSGLLCISLLMDEERVFVSRFLGHSSVCSLSFFRGSVWTVLLFDLKWRLTHVADSSNMQVETGLLHLLFHFTLLFPPSGARKTPRGLPVA